MIFVEDVRVNVENEPHWRWYVKAGFKASVQDSDNEEQNSGKY